MGQRVNYVIRNGDRLTIHYHHWRANDIAADLYLGEKKFLAFVDTCAIKEQLINEPWIEGCVIIDKDNRRLHFWMLEFGDETSVIEYYLLALAKVWPGWELQFLPHAMYDIEKILGITYCALQELPPLHPLSEDALISAEDTSFEHSLVVIKGKDHLKAVATGNLYIEELLGYGERIIAVLLNRPGCALPAEEVAPYECMVIDTDQRHIYIGELHFGLWEQVAQLWDGYQVTHGYYGYLKTLALAGIDTSGLYMAPGVVKERFAELIKPSDSFDPGTIAAVILQEDKDARLHPDFLDNVVPGRSPGKSWISLIRRLVGLK